MDLRTRISRLERAATRTDGCQSGLFPDECICFPENEPPNITYRAEVEIAASLLCPLHGQRFRHIAADGFSVYVPKWYRERNAAPEWPSGSPQYVKAMRASFSAEQWPAETKYEFKPERRVILVLRDGTEIDSGGEAEEWWHSKRGESQ